MYRPQFAYLPAVPPCEDQPCIYSFDKTNVPSFAGVTLSAGAITGRIPLRLDDDADFYMRAIRMTGLSGPDAFGAISIRLEDPGLGNPLSDSDDQTLGTNYELRLMYATCDGPLLRSIVTKESGAGGVFAPAGGNFGLYLYNSSTADILLDSLSIQLIGIKRYPGGCTTK